jgi:hypothetical protein
MYHFRKFGSTNSSSNTVLESASTAINPATKEVFARYPYQIRSEVSALLAGIREFTIAQIVWVNRR